MKKGFLFSFSHLSDLSLFYEAVFTLPGKLRLDLKKKKEPTTLLKLYGGLETEPVGSFEKEEAWERFYKNATEEDVLIGRIPLDLDKDFKRDNEFLTLLRQRHDFLDFDLVRKRFYRIFSRAKSGDRATRQEAKALLESYFIPRHPCGRRIHPEYRYQIELLRRLYRHLSREWKGFLIKKRLWEGKKEFYTSSTQWDKERWLSSWKERYEALLVHFKDVRIPSDPLALERLIDSPTDYAVEILASRFLLSKSRLRQKS